MSGNSLFLPEVKNGINVKRSEVRDKQDIIHTIAPNNKNYFSPK